MRGLWGGATSTCSGVVPLVAASAVAAGSMLLQLLLLLLLLAGAVRSSKMLENASLQWREG